MIKIRLARLGAKKKPIYRVVVADSRDGVFIQQYSTKSKEDAIKYVAVFAYQHSEELEPIGNQIAAAL